ncbi:hypothetical protein FOMPIDRAFT_52139 [Fomitopsis schrenkii]|uniref:DUF4100 domain-containing protein n=1 Tax=Fomitopsis schrenkii TaxID=2126942 RepID=S8DWS1_FOMSC|nr:hypothetical protein FOMPIDRAFT_52139 [Fomitopsis schrenkii]
MPAPESRTVPRFTGRHLTDFLRRYENVAKLAGLTDTEKCDQVLDYCSYAVRDSFKYNKVFKGSDWAKVKKDMERRYGDDDTGVKFSGKELREFSDECRRRHKITNLTDFRRYLRAFGKKEGDLVEKKRMLESEWNFLFYQGLNAALRRAITDKLEKMKGSELLESDMASMEQVIDAVEEYFSRDRVERNIPNDENSESEDDLDDLLGDDEEEDEEELVRGLKSRLRVKAATKTVKEKGKEKKEEGEMAKAMSNMMKTMEQVLSKLTVSPAGVQPTPVQATVNAANLARLCWMCAKEEGKDLDHRIGLGNCPLTRKYIADGVIMHNPQGRLVYVDGTELPNARGVPGGMSTLIQQRVDQQAQQQKLAKGKGRDVPPHMGGSASAIELLRDDELLLGGNVYAVSSEDVTSFATTRSQTKKATDQQDEASSSKKTLFDFRHTIPPGDQVPMRRAKSPPPGKAIEEVVVEPPKVNTEQGWRERKQVRRSEDEQAGRARGKANVRFTSDVQESVSPEQVQDKILNTMISIPLKMILAMSPDLQKRMAAITKTRREVSTSAAIIDDDEVAGDAAVTVKDEKDLEEVVNRYAAAVAIGQKRFVAMVCGLVQGKFGDEPVTFLIDSGSELNLVAKRVFAHSGVDIDKDGARWTLRGIHGEPVPLVGCCRDAPVTLGGTRFDHHFFVHPGELGRHDGILGQPWLLWFSSRLEYTRGGGQDLVAYPGGDSKGEPVRVRVAGVANRRNVSYAEEGSDDSDDEGFR